MLYLFNRILPYLSALLVGITFTLWIIRPEWAWYYGGALFLIATLTLWSLTSESAERRAFWQFIATPLALLASAFAYFFVIDNNVLRSLFIGGIVIIYVLILRNIYSRSCITRSSTNPTRWRTFIDMSICSRCFYFMALFSDSQCSSPGHFGYLLSSCLS